MDGRVSGSKGGVANVGLMLVSETSTFNIANIVGIENVGKYSKHDFIVCDNLSNEFRQNGIVPATVRESAMVDMYCTISNEFEVNYDNTTGDVIISQKTLNFATKMYWSTSTGSEYATTRVSFTIPPKVYLCVKTNGAMMPTSIEIPEETKLVSVEISETDENGNTIEYKEIYENGVVIDTIYYDKNGNEITESEE